MKGFIVTALNTKGEGGLRNLRLEGRLKRLCTYVITEEPYKKEVLFKNKKLRDSIKLDDVQSLLYNYPLLIGCQLVLNKDYYLEVIP
jgi:hypothetical protein